ncbi:MAG: YybH family protein [Verrucomicrobiota bacterium]
MKVEGGIGRWAKWGAVLGMGWLAASGCVAPRGMQGRQVARGVPGEALAAADIRAVLGAQVDAWNRGSIDDFMAGYDASTGTRFASGGDVTLGWETVRNRYRARYTSREAMGRLAFTGLDVRVLSADDALVFGTWTLTRSGDAPTGLFTLLMHRTPAGWRVVHDHTSSAER